MKRNLAIALFALTTFGTAASVLAQAPAVEANVPFQFTVGGKTLPAGAYTITSTSAGVVQIANADKRFTAESVAYRGNEQSTDGSKLVFEKYGKQYFLHDLMCPANSTLNVHLPKSGQETACRDCGSQARRRRGNRSSSLLSNESFITKDGPETCLSGPCSFRQIHRNT